MHAVYVKLSSTCSSAACPLPRPRSAASSNSPPVQQASGVCTCSPEHTTVTTRHTVDQENVSWLLVESSCPAGTMNEPGHDGRGNDYANPQELWERSKDADGSHEAWYKGAVEYWDKQEASYDGVLGGFGCVSDADINDSRQLLVKVLKQVLKAEDNQELTVIDCGAGVGRVSEQLLLHHFAVVDLLEPSRHLLDTAITNLNSAISNGTYPPGRRLGQQLCSGLQQFTPEAGRYDCIWIQWCLLYLTDEDVVKLLDCCKAGLKPGGCIWIKENICKEGFIVDKDDNSLTRSNAYMLDLIQRTGLNLRYNIAQKNFPKGLYSVRMYVLQP